MYEIRTDAASEGRLWVGLQSLLYLRRNGGVAPIPAVAPTTIEPRGSASAVIRRYGTDHPEREQQGGPSQHSMIRLGGRSRRGPQMIATPASTFYHPHPIISEFH